MNSETKICQNCKANFTIAPDDFSFYEKIKVPAPTFCPECRMIERMIWRNERTLYKKNNSASKNSEKILSMYSSDSVYTIYDKEYWWSDKWDPLDYGRDYDFSKPFFQQYSELLKKIPLPALQLMNSVSSDYSNYIDGNKNCYLVFGCGMCENLRFSNKVHFSKDSQDLMTSSRDELCFDLLNCHNCFRLVSSINCNDCVDSYFLYNCKNCQNCFGCSNLVNKSWCYFNSQLTKEQYQEKVNSLDLSNYSFLEKLKEKVKSVIYSKTIRKFANIIRCVNCTGDNIGDSKNCNYSFDILENVEDSKFLMHSLHLKDNYDAYGTYQNELSYQTVDCDTGMNNISIITVYSSNNCSYSFTCQSSNYLLGCIGLRGNQYCILNKQYSKEQYESLFPKIIKHMNDMPYVDKMGRIYKYGEFFPSELSQFCYNETIAQEYFPLTKEEVKKRGHGWKEKEDRNYLVGIKSEQIPDSINDINEEIIGKVIECAHKGECNQQCTEAFKIIPEEFQFYKRMNLPIPRLCPNCRHYERLAQRNPLKLWHRKCMKEGCTNEFETSYAPDRPEIIYCERCYQQEVY
jgi:cytochrome c-type biogenesis protein CcmH/NrfF